MCGDLDRKNLGRTTVKKCSEVVGMAATMTADLARDAFMSRDYRLACELFEQVLREQAGPEDQSTEGESSKSQQRLSLYYGYGDSLARAGRLKDALDVYGHIAGVLESGLIPLERLRHLTSSLVETVLATRHTLAKSSTNSPVDPLCCPICEDILRFPVTATCGHTFCRQCCFGHSSCTVCHTRFPTIPSSSSSPSPSPGPSSTVTLLSLPATVTSEEPVASSSSSASAASGPKRDSVIGFEQDILIRRLVERWWGPELKAAELNEEAQRYLDGGMGGGPGGDGGQQQQQQGLDEALRCCNQSLENGNYPSFSDQSSTHQRSERTPSERSQPI